MSAASVLDALAQARLTEATQAVPFDAKTVDEHAAEHVPQVVQGLIYGVDAAAGAPNSGKSAFGVDLGLHVAAGVPFFGRKVRSGPVLYVAAESPGGIIERARAAIRSKFGGGRVPFYVIKDVPRLGDETIGEIELERLIATARTVASTEGETVRLTIWDTVAMLLAGAEENGDGMLRLVAAAQTFHQRTGSCVLMLHHPSKADANGLRGHSSLAGAVDVILAIVSDAASGTRTVTVTKSRDGEAGAQIHFRLEPVLQPEPDEFGDPVTTIIVRPADTLPAAKREPAGKAQRSLLTALCVRAAESPGAIWAHDELRRIGRDLGQHRNTARDAVLGLVQSGFLVPTVGGYRLQDGLT